MDVFTERPHIIGMARRNHSALGFQVARPTGVQPKPGSRDFTSGLVAAFRGAAKAAVEGALAAGVPVFGIDKNGRPVERRPDGSLRPLEKRIRRRKIDTGQD